MRLPKKRTGFTQEARVGGHKIFLRTGEYEDGIARRDLHRHAQRRRRLPLADELLRDVGVGRPAVRRAAATYVEQFTFTRFEPQGMVEGHPNVKFSTSIVDYLFRVLGVEYLHRYDLAHVKPDIRGTRTRRDVGPRRARKTRAASAANCRGLRAKALELHQSEARRAARP